MFSILARAVLLAAPLWSCSAGEGDPETCGVGQCAAAEVASASFATDACDSVGSLWKFAADGTNVEETLQTWAASCGSSTAVDECRRLARNASWLFQCAQTALVNRTRDASGHERFALLMLRTASALSAASAWDKPKVFEESVPCRRPANLSEAARRFDEELLAVELTPGRVCQDGACSDRCGVVVLDDVLTQEETDALIEHGEVVLSLSHGTRTRAASDKEQIDLHLSAQLGDKATHLLFMFVLERLRRLVALAAGVPVSWVHFASHFLSRKDATAQAAPAQEEVTDADADADANQSGTIHCDESSYARFHHSGVLWLTAQDDDTGGEVEFWDADNRLWRRKLQPMPGRVVLFTSGWENIHRVTALKSGRRWSLPLFASLRPPLNATRIAKACVWPSGSKQWQYCEDRMQQWLSAPDEDLF